MADTQQLASTLSEAWALSSFEGLWRLKRRIIHADGIVDRFDGQSLWEPDTDGLRQTETGTLHLHNAASVEGSRSYRWKDGVDVYFDDGRFFHRVPACEETARHLCLPDTYVGHYDFVDSDRFEIHWTVEGPRKSYRMHTVYTRLD